MSTSKRPETVQMKVRIPVALRDEIEAAAWRNRRSINGEILVRLELAAKLMPAPLPEGYSLAYHAPAVAEVTAFLTPTHHDALDPVQRKMQERAQE